MGLHRVPITASTRDTYSEWTSELYEFCAIVVCPRGDSRTQSKIAAWANGFRTILFKRYWYVYPILKYMYILSLPGCHGHAAWLRESDSFLCEYFV